MPAEKLCGYNELHLLKTAQIIRQGGIVAFPFNGVFGLFGNIDDSDAYQQIYLAKGRLEDRKLIAACTPESVDGFVDFSKQSHPKDQVLALWKYVHALGIILPASEGAPKDLVVGNAKTFLNIWTEYHPLRQLEQHLEKLGIRGLVGTSANKSGHPTHFDADQLWEEFENDVEAVIFDSFDQLPPYRRQSTTIIDLTTTIPRLHRRGNVTEDELKEALEKHHFPPLT